MRIVVPDLVSPSYFPAIAASELGFFADEGLDVNLELLFPVTDAAACLRDGTVDFLAGAAHAPLYAFEEWQGVKLCAALSQNMYWFLVVRADLAAAHGDLSILDGLRIGAAPGPVDGLRQMLVAQGIDPEARNISLQPIPGSQSAGMSFGVGAAEALANGSIDAFWANGMGAEVAVLDGVGTVVADARRDGGPYADYTFPALMTTERQLSERPEESAAVVRAVLSAQHELRAEPGLARRVGEALFPSREADLITSLIARDASFYTPQITAESVTALNQFAAQVGLPVGVAGYDDVVSPEMAKLWDSPV